MALKLYTTNSFTGSGYVLLQQHFALDLFNFVIIPSMFLQKSVHVLFEHLNTMLPPIPSSCLKL